MLKFLLIFFLFSCDSVTVNYKVGSCMEHAWAYKGIYRVKSRDGMKVSLVNIKTNEELEINAMDKRWSEVSCF